MSQATIVFNDPRQLYAGTAKFDGSLEERKKFKEDFEKVCKKVNPLAYFITQRVIPIRKIPGDKYGGHEWDRDAHIKRWERVQDLPREIRWSRNAYTIKELISCGHLPKKFVESEKGSDELTEKDKLEAKIADLQAKLRERLQEVVSKATPRKDTNEEGEHEDEVMLDSPGVAAPRCPEGFRYAILTEEIQKARTDIEQILGKLVKHSKMELIFRNEESVLIQAEQKYWVLVGEEIEQSQRIDLNTAWQNLFATKRNKRSNAEVWQSLAKAANFILDASEGLTLAQGIWDAKVSMFLQCLDQDKGLTLPEKIQNANLKSLILRSTRQDLSEKKLWETIKLYSKTEEVSSRKSDHRVDNGMSAGGKGDGKKSSATCFACGGNHTLRNCKNKKKLREFKSKFPDRYQKYRGRFEDKADAKRSKDEEEDFGVSFASRGMTMPGLISGSDSSEDDDDYTDMPGLLSASDSESDSDDDESRYSSYESMDSEDDATGDDDIPGLASDSESESGDEQTLKSKFEANADGLSCPAIGKSKKSILKNAASFMAASETPILDSGATHSQWPVLDEMHNVTDDVPSLRLMTSNGTVMLTKAGNVGKVQKVYYNPHSPPILSLGQMLDNNEHIAFLATQNAGYFVKKKFIKAKLKEHRGKKVYQKVARRIPHELWTPVPSIFGLSKVMDGKSAVGSKDMVLENQAYQWHLRLGHVSTDTLKAMRKLNRIDFTDKDVKEMESFPCNSCLSAGKKKPGKSKGGRKSDVERNAKRPNLLGDVVNLDLRVYGKTSVIGGYRYAAVAVDQATRYMWVAGLSDNSGATLTKCVELLADTISRSNSKLKELVTDGECAIKGSKFTAMCQKRGIKLRITNRGKDHVKQNMVEAKISQIRSVGKKLRAARHLGDEYTLLSEKYAAYLLNVLPTSGLGGRTPWQERYKENFDYSKLRTFGAVAWQTNYRDGNRPLIFVGVNPERTGYQCYCPRTKKFHYLDNPIWDETNNVTENYVSEIAHGLTITYRKRSANTVKQTPHVSSQAEEEPNPNPADIEEELEEAKIEEEQPQLNSESEVEVEAGAVPILSDPEMDAIEEEINAVVDNLFDGQNDVEDQEAMESPTVRRSSRIRNPVVRFPEPQSKMMHEGISLAAKPATVAEGTVVRESLVTTKNEMSGMSLSSKSERHPTLLKETYPPAREIPWPVNTREARKSVYAAEFRKAEEVELDALRQHGTFRFVPKGQQKRHKLRTRFVYAVKHDSKGEVTKFKARLVVLGFGQIWGQEYKETFAPTAHEGTIKFAVAIAAKLGLKRKIWDYMGAYLHGKMDKPIYLQDIEGLEVPNGCDVLCYKSLYGTKQAGHIWNKEWTSSMIKLGFRQSKYDPCLLVKRTDEGVCYAIAWVDDVILIYNLPEEKMKGLEESVKRLGFILSNSENLEYYLGIRIQFEGEKVTMSQKAYLEAILHRFGLENSKAAKSPMNHADLPKKADCPDLETELGRAERERLKSFKYRNAIGSLQHLARWTRPDIKFAVGYLARYQENFSEKHVKAVKRIFRYLKGTIDKGITFGGTNTPLVMYVDADFAMDPDQRKSTTGWVSLFFGGPGTSKSKLQPILADSTTVAELIALHDACREAKWLSWLISEFGCTPNYSVSVKKDNLLSCKLLQNENLQKGEKEEKDPVFIYEDNNGVIAISKHQMVSQRTKHVEVKYFYVQELVAEQIIVVERCDTNFNLADIMTKALPVNKHINMANYFFRGEDPVSGRSLVTRNIIEM